VAVRVVVVMGAQRTGSTLLATVLGMVPGAWISGELALLWASVVQGRPCACLRRCTDCPIWTDVLDAALNDPSVLPRTTDDLSALTYAHVRMRKVHRLLAQRGGFDPGSDLAALAAATRRVYEGLAAVSGAQVVVDSSKNPAVVAFLRNVPGIELRAVHLVRDPRGVVDSWSRPKSWARDGWDETLYAKPLTVASSGWAGMNAGAEAVRLALGPSHTPRVRFEDFLARPEPVLRSLIDVAGLPQPSSEDLPLKDGAAIIGENHAIGGNVDRFDVGPVPLRAEESWRNRLSPARQGAVVAATLPLMLRYGYRPDFWRT
jgi:hypothetical protein